MLLDDELGPHAPIAVIGDRAIQREGARGEDRFLGEGEAGRHVLLDRQALDAQPVAHRALIGDVELDAARLRG